MSRHRLPTLTCTLYPRMLGSRCRGYAVKTRKTILLSAFLYEYSFTEFCFCLTVNMVGVHDVLLAVPFAEWRGVRGPD